MNSPSLIPLTVPLLTISRCDRWQAYQRLHTLQIPCQCTADGRLEVCVNSPLAALQVRSVVQQLTASRSELVHWLGRCWQAN